MYVEPPQLLLLPLPGEGERPGDDLPERSPHASTRLDRNARPNSQNQVWWKIIEEDKKRRRTRTLAKIYSSASLFFPAAPAMYGRGSENCASPLNGILFLDF